MSTSDALGPGAASRHSAEPVAAPAVRSAVLVLELVDRLGRIRNIRYVPEKIRLRAAGVRKMIQRERKQHRRRSEIASRWINEAEELLVADPDELIGYLRHYASMELGYDAIALAGAAYRRTAEPGTRNQLRQLMARIGVHLADGGGPAAAERPVAVAQSGARGSRSELETLAQRRVRDFVTAMGRLFFSGAATSVAIQPRLFPLIVGPTGAGKSHLVRAAAARLGAHYLKACYGDWIPRGVRDRTDTMTVIMDTLLAHPRVVLHLDELDKWPLAHGDHAGAWHVSLCNDLWAVLDGDLDPERYRREHRSEQPQLRHAPLEDLVRRRLWIVGSGTWQDVFDTRPRTLGFASFGGDAVGADIVRAIHDAKLISPELIARFHASLQVISYPDLRETAHLLRRSGLDALARRLGIRLDPAEVDYRRGGLRVLESIAADLLAREQLAPGLAGRP